MSAIKGIYALVFSLVGIGMILAGVSTGEGLATLVWLGVLFIVGGVLGVKLLAWGFDN